ncbi:MAG: hypothetical protein HXX16_10315 [Bacteroidales bacterium]|nr:hypothetical protein [Bacteroidales bacterium]
MKKSKFIQLVLVAATISSCNSVNSGRERKIYMRSDTTAKYTQTRSYLNHGGFYAFRPFGVITPNGYRRTGYYSSGIHESSSFGTSSSRSSVSRAGFGRSAFHVSS